MNKLESGSILFLAQIDCQAEEEWNATNIKLVPAKCMMYHKKLSSAVLYGKIAGKITVKMNRDKPTQFSMKTLSSFPYQQKNFSFILFCYL